MLYEWMGRAHAALVGRQAGQGTVEYVGLLFLMGVVIAGVVAASSKAGGADIGKTIVSKLKAALDAVGKS